MRAALPTDGLLHPVALAAIALTAVNDHLLKHAFASWWTGKLSDVAGLVFFPLFLQALFELAGRLAGRPWGPSRAVLVGAALLTGVTFLLVQTWLPATEAYRVVWGVLYWPLASLRELLASGATADWTPVQVWADPSDLLALPALGVAVWAGWRRSGGSPAARGALAA